ncbi:MAG: endonuclease/exonuclease/phosphatase family protein [Ignavibacteriales bacterium]|nr:endonuclease/exonuclease/phosphatase family protein [Ignavibacteriales bacterium]
MIVHKEFRLMNVKRKLSREQRHLSKSAFAALPLFFIGCASQPAQRGDAPPKPDITVQVASLNLASYNKRIERAELRKLTAVLKKEQVDVLAVQGITRYPGVETRVDFVDELAKLADVNSAFGEMVNNSGRQTGNAVFSSYPIRSKFNQSFEKVKSAKFEAALQAVIDGGTREVHVVSAQLPKTSLEDQIACVAAVSSLTTSAKNEAVILAGNLPVSEKAVVRSGYEDAQRQSGKNTNTRIWYLQNDAVKLISTRSVETDFGSMLVAQFGLFRQQLP